MSHWETIIFVLIILGLSLWVATKSQTKSTQIEQFNPYINYSRTYPGIFSFQPGVMYYNKLFYDNWPANFIPSQISWGLQSSWPGNYRYNPGYRDYWYIPAYDVLNLQVNGLQDGRTIPRECLVPPSISPDCVKNRTNQTGNLDLSILQCTVPTSISDSCPLLKDWAKSLPTTQLTPNDMLINSLMR